MKLKTGIYWGERGCKTKDLPWGEYGYFLELYIMPSSINSRQGMKSSMSIIVRQGC